MPQKMKIATALLVLIGLSINATPVLAEEQATAPTPQQAAPSQPSNEYKVHQPYDGFYHLKVGEKKPIHAARTDNCKSVPEFKDVAKELPQSDIIEFMDGGPTKRFSKQCQKVVPALMILAKGIKAGKQQLDLFGYKINAIVE